MTICKYKRGDAPFSGDEQLIQPNLQYNHQQDITHTSFSNDFNITQTSFSNDFNLYNPNLKSVNDSLKKLNENTVAI